MTSWAAIALGLAALAAVVDWWSVATDRRRVEYVAKPAVLIALIAAACTLEPASDVVRWWFVAGLAFGLIGDVLLMLDRFIPGAAAFLIGHVAYAAGLLTVPLQPGWLLAGTVLLIAILGVAGGRIVGAASEKSSTLGAIVGAYLIALGAVLVLGVGTAVPAAIAGVVLFSLSDALLAWGRFVGPAPGGRTLVHVTYHCAQGLLVVALLTL